MSNKCFAPSSKGEILVQQSVLDKGTRVLLEVAFTELGNPWAGLLDHRSGHREHDPHVSRVLKAAARQTEDALLVDQLLDKVGVVLEGREALDAHADHHVHGPIGHHGVKAAHLLQDLVGQCGIRLWERKVGMFRLIQLKIKNVRSIYRNHILHTKKKEFFYCFDE